MRSRLQLWHAVDEQLHRLLPTAHRARLHVLALLTVGMLLAETVVLPRIAATLPLAVRRASLEKRFARFLANASVDPAALWTGLLPHLLADRAGTAVDLVFDPTPHNGTFTVLVLGLIDHSRVLPVAWAVVPQQTAWDESQIAILPRLCTTVATALPADCRVTLLADRGITSPAVIALCRRLGWAFVLRLSVSARQTNRVRLGDGPDRLLWDLVTGPGQRLTVPAHLFKEAGWVPVVLTIRWDPRYRAPWVLLTEAADAGAAARIYRRRFRVEATYQDAKSRGWHLESSRIAAADRFDRLLLALHLALWWALAVGHRVIRAGLRARYDRPDRRDLGVLRLGRDHLHTELLFDRCPPLPFRRLPATTPRRLQNVSGREGDSLLPAQQGEGI
jgi:Transposase DDE domain